MLGTVLTSVHMLAHLSCTDSMLSEKKLKCVRARLIRVDLTQIFFIKFSKLSKIGKSDNTFMCV